MHPVKALTVDFGLIKESMTDLSRESSEYYLDRHSGKVISLSRDLIRSITNEGFESRLELPEWDACLIPLARKIVLEASSEFIRITEAYGQPEQNMRIAFTETVKSEPLRRALVLALRGRGSRKRFVEKLKEHPHELRRWLEFRETKWKERISQWLESVGLLAIESPGKNRVPI